ncbi:MAG: hypothetical protein ACP5HC_06440 [Caldisericum sp.]
MTTKKLVEVLKAVPASLKAEGRNEYLKYGYLTLDQLKITFHRIFAEKGIVFLFETENVDVKEAGEGFLTTASFVVRLLDEEGEVRIHTFGQAYDKEGKGLAKAKTDALKRFFTDSFLIAVGEEDEDTTYGKTEADTQQNTQPPKSDAKVLKRVYDPIYGDEERATEPQIKKIYALAQQLGIKKEDLQKEVKEVAGENLVNIDDLSKTEASALIQKLMSRKT